MAPATLPTVLVIGGGPAGVNVAQKLKGIATVVLIDKKDYFDVSPANVRSVVEPATAAKTSFLYKDIKNLDMGRFIQGSVVELQAKSAKLEGGQVVPFDYCVIAVGSKYAASWAKAEVGTLAARRAELKNESELIKAAKNIVVIGGGAVGVETAAEILEAYAGKNVTIVTPGQTLLEENTKIAPTVLAWLTSHGCKVIFGDRIDSVPAVLPAVLVTKGGKEVPADYVLKCAGTTVHTEFMKGDLASAVVARGLIKVNDFLQVEGFPHMWAIGDCNSVPETKLAYLAAMQGGLAAGNIAAVIAGKKQTAWKLFGGMKAQFISLGRKTGAGILGSCTCPGFMVSAMKSKELFIPKIRAEMLISP